MDVPRVAKETNAVTSATSLRLLILGAHPDDAEFHAGGLAVRYRRAGHAVRMVSVTNGAAGHHRLSAEELAEVRRREAAAAGRVIGAEYHVWEFADGALFPTLELRHRIIAEIRTFRPDLVLTHRTCDYHPDHRAVGQAVQDASYLVTVPLVLPEVPFLRQDPVVAYMVDLFRKPVPLEPDVVLDIDGEIDTVIRMLACHRSQVFDFLPFNQRIEPPESHDEEQERTWLLKWYDSLCRERVERFRDVLARCVGEERAAQARFVEAYEISEYAAQIDERRLEELFLMRASPTRSEAGGRRL